jgi:SH3-like domain-containing protein
MLAATTAPGDVAFDGLSLGFMTSVTGDRVGLRRSPTTAGSIIMELSSAVPLLVIGDTGDWQRVVLPDGTSGFVASWLTDASYSDRQP